MSDGRQKKTRDRLSIRTSVIVWLSGAVLGWVVAVLAIYSIMRVPDRNVPDVITGKTETMQANHSPSDAGNANNLSKIEPASGSTAKTAETEENKP